MSIDDIKTSKRLKKIAEENFGEEYRLKLSERILEVARQIVENGGYKNAWAGLGRMVTLNKAIDDDYMREKIVDGKAAEEEAFDMIEDQNVFLRVDVVAGGCYENKYKIVEIEVKK